MSILHDDKMEGDKMAFKLPKKLTRLIIKYQWRSKNMHNSTKMNSDFRLQNVRVGIASYGMLNVIDYSDEESKLFIGNYCSIAPNVTFVLGGEHNLSTISTFPFKARTLQEGNFEAGSKGDIHIEDDVWIGVGATIMSGVTIGQGAVIAASSLVSKDVPPYAVVGGVPAKIIRYRFSDEIIHKLKNVDYSKLTKEIIVDNLGALYKEVTNDNVDYLVKMIFND